MEETYRYEIKIPKERVSMLIGKAGEIKKKIEEDCSCILKIDSQEGDVFVKGENALNLLSAREIIQAVGRGYNPDIACLLIKQDYVLEIIKLTDYNKHKNHMLRMKGRVIGTRGKSRKHLEDSTGTYISVYGKTIGILGRNEDVGICRRAVEMILEGSPHSSVYKWLERQLSALRRKELLGNSHKTTES